ARAEPVNLWIARRRHRSAGPIRPADASDLVPLGPAVVDGPNPGRALRAAAVTCSFHRQAGVSVARIERREVASPGASVLGFRASPLGRARNDDLENW